MVDEEIEQAPPDAPGAERRHPHGQGAGVDNFRQILDMKADAETDEGRAEKATRSPIDGRQAHHHRTVRRGRLARVGREDGIAIVKEAVMGLIKRTTYDEGDDQPDHAAYCPRSEREPQGEELQLDTLAEELHNERLNEGIAIIKESHSEPVENLYPRGMEKTTTASGGTSCWA